MPRQFTITDFIAHRWGEARAEMSHHDPAFVATMSVYFDVKERGLILPDTPPPPSHRLGAEWYELLESTIDVAQQLNRLELTVRKIEAAPNRAEAEYYHETWVQEIYNLCEKIGRMISVSCSLNSLGGLKDKYRLEIEEKIQNNASRKRHAYVHGADEPKKGGLGISARGITEDHLWEVHVAVGPEVIPYTLDSTHRKPPEWLRQTRQVTSDILTELGNILSRLHEHILSAANTG